MVTVTILSFGFKRSGVPADTTGNGGGFVFDCRALTNPGAQLRFADMNGLDAEVRDFLAGHPEVDEFLSHAFALVEASVQRYDERGFGDLLVAFGCTGGQHRSVYCAERLAAHLRDRGVHVRVEHTERGTYW